MSLGGLVYAVGGAIVAIGLRNIYETFANGGTYQRKRDKFPLGLVNGIVAGFLLFMYFFLPEGFLGDPEVSNAAGHRYGFVLGIAIMMFVESLIKVRRGYIAPAGTI